MRALNPQVVCLCAALAFAPTLASAQAPAATIAVASRSRVIIPGGPGGFDYMTVDRGLHRVYATHKGTHSLAAVDLTNDQPLTSPDVGRTQGIAVDRRTQSLFLGGEDEHRMLALDRATLQQKGVLTVDGPVDDIALDPRDHLILAEQDEGTVVPSVSIMGETVGDLGSSRSTKRARKVL